MTCIIAVTLALGAGSAFAGSGAPVEDVRLGDILELLYRWRLALLALATLAVACLLWAGDVIRPGSIARSGQRDVNAYPAMIWIFAALLVYLTTAMSYTFAAQQPWITAQAPDGSLRYTAAVTGAAMTIAAIVAIGMSYLMARGVTKTGLRVHPADLPLGLLALLLAYPVVALVGSLAAGAHAAITSEPPSQLAHPILEALSGNLADPWAWLLIAAVVLGAPIVEEILYRGFLQSAMLRAFKSPWIAIVCTSLVFTLAHAPGGIPWYALLTLFTLSIALGLAFERTRHIGVPIVMHVAFNALNIAMAA
ncbi:MAG: CPBP family intramembrane metalloprotease [Phycisphaerales bacterium]|nr:MAG: CPBP family intramembrane metalloprotease [Phycisphaerales bacterium]